MSTRRQRRFSPEQKVAIVRRHRLEQVPVSDLCDEHSIHPTVFYRWQKQLFENGPPRSNGTRTPRFLSLDGSPSWRRSSPPRTR